MVVPQTIRKMGGILEQFEFLDDVRRMNKRQVSKNHSLLLLIVMYSFNSFLFCRCCAVVINSQLLALLFFYDQTIDLITHRMKAECDI